MDSLDGFVTDDHLALLELERRGWRVTEAPWRRPQDWSAYDIVVVRSTWDYQHAPEAFSSMLRTIGRSGTRLENPVELMTWNLDKRYLEDLRSRGVPVVPTCWLDPSFDRAALAEAFDALDSEELVIKPSISANAQRTHRLFRDQLDALWPTLEEDFEDDLALVQPFLPSVVEEGEISLVYFDGTFSHAGCKLPADGDFRVQEEHGGVLRPMQPSPAMRALAEKTLAQLPQVPLYARVDLLRARATEFDSHAFALEPVRPPSEDDEPLEGIDDWLLMELELIEPSLYLQLHPAASSRFARAITRRLEDG